MVRPAEAVSVEWSEIDLNKKIWVIPKEKMKKVRTGRFSHSVPLSRQMINILEQLKPITGHHKYVFPSFTKPNPAMSKDTIANALREIGYQGKQDAHGLRAIARTYLEDNMIDFRLAESIRLVRSITVLTTSNSVAQLCNFGWIMCTRIF